MFGLGSWLMNFAQYSWSDMNAKVLADIPSPYIEYNMYWTFKIAEVVSLLGGCIAHPIYRIYLYRKLTPETKTNNSYKGRLLLGGLAAAPFLTVGSIYINSYTKEDVRDKCYEIRCNSIGLLYDRNTVALGILGWYWKRFQGAVDGINLATAYTAFYLTISQQYLNPMLKDKLTEKDRFVNLDEARNNESVFLRFINKPLKNSSSDFNQSFITK